ncbi:MAG: TlpA disulfide reductase family protein [Planctomycetota bacterium]
MTRTQIGGAVASLLTLATIVFLGHRLSSQEARLEDLAERIAFANAALRPVAEVPTRLVSTVRGESLLLGASRGGTRLLFFSANCPHCRDAAPGWREEANRLADRGIALVAVCVEEGRGREFADDLALDLPVVEDPGGALRRQLGVDAYPTRLQLDRRGRVRLRDVALAAVDARVGGLGAAMETWPTSARDALVRTLARDIAPEVESVVRMPLSHGGQPIFVCEGADGLVGFASLLSWTSDYPNSSDLEALAWLDRDGRIERIVPLRVHRERGQVVGSDELLEWCRSEVLERGRGPLADSLHAHVRRLAKDFGRERPAAVSIADEPR